MVKKQEEKGQSIGDQMDMVLKIWNNLCKKYKKEEIKKAEDATDKTNKGGVNPNLQGKPNDIVRCLIRMKV